MKCVIQRSGLAKVSVGDQVVGRIAGGLVVLAGFASHDTEAELAWMARKIPNLRIFNDEAGRMNLSLRDRGGEILLISQFTLYADCRKGQRPSFVASAPPGQAEALYARFGALLRENWPQVAEGRFGAMMEVSLVNEGPVTIVLERSAAGA